MNSEDYDEKADVYSFAVIMYELLTKTEFLGHFSFMSDIERMVVTGQRPDIPTDPDCTKIPEYIKLMADCWSQGKPTHQLYRQTRQKLTETFL